MLHAKDTVRDALDDDVFASNDLSVSMPKYRIPETEQDPRHAYQVVADELLLDGNSRQNLATFCQTWLEPEVHRLMDLTLDKNMIDKDEYPQTAELEARCVHILADLWNSPDAANTLGTSTTGSSEAAMLGGMALLWKWRARQRAAGQPDDKPNLVTGPVQICWHKFARYWDVEHREIPMEGDRLIMTAEEVLKRVDENTIGVVPTLGVTFTVRLRAGEGRRRRARRAAGGDRPRRPDPRRRRERRLPGARSSSRTSSGTSGSRGSSRSTRRATSSASRRSASAG